jgi:hypothetical protein
MLLQYGPTATSCQGSKKHRPHHGVLRRRAIGQAYQLYRRHDTIPPRTKHVGPKVICPACDRVPIMLHSVPEVMENHKQLNFAVGTPTREENTTISKVTLPS